MSGARTKRKPLVPTDDDRRHLIEAIKDTEEGWKLHPFTCTRFTLLGWLEPRGWTQAAYVVRNEQRGVR